jgi:copper chaperone
MATAQLNVKGMKCGGCEKSVQEAVNALAGVLSSKASAPDGRVEVEYDDAQATLAQIKQAIAAKGYATD